MDVKQKIKEFILKEICEDLGLDIQNIDDDEQLIDEGILDSLEILKLLSFLDEEFNIAIPAEKVNLENFKNLNTICEMIYSTEK